jgi:arsenical pump membrane protein
MHESWAAVLGAVLMLAFGLETWRQAWSTVRQGADVLLFLFALMLLSTLLDASGFFEWAAIHAAKAARGDVMTLFRNVFFLGASITAFLSLDTTAIILTPIVMAFVARLHLRAKPFLIACAMVANTASLLMPVSNLTNLLFQSRLHFGFGIFTAHMLLPQIVAIGVNYYVLFRLFESDLSDSFDAESLPNAESVIDDRPFFRIAVGTLIGILIGYFVGSALHIPPYIIALIGCGVLLTFGLARGRIHKSTVMRDISWPLFPFVAGLFVVIRGVENLGLAPLAAHALADAGRSPLAQVLATAFGAGIGSNVVNNIPMALLSLSVLGESGNRVTEAYGAILGCNIGPNLTIVGSLAAMLVLTSARQRGQDLKGMEFFRAGVIATPLILVAASLALWVVLR